jgi:hypothetical protein
MATKRGRPPVKDEQKAKFRNVAVPLEHYEMLRQISEEQDRSMARQLAVLIREAYQQTRGAT